jgi:hypothetical protein
VKRDVAIFIAFLALAVALTWPLVLQLDSAVPDRGDPLLNAWIIDWVCHALTHAPLHLYDAPIYHPGRYPLAYSENMVGIALVVLPLHLAGLSALTVYNLALLLGFAFSAYGAFVLARMITRNTAAAFLGGVFFAFASFKVAHVQHVQIIWSGWLPLMLAALLAYWSARDTRHAAWLGAAFLMNGLTNIYWLMFGGFALVVTIAFLALADPRRDRAFWLRLGGALALASLLLLPFLVPYAIVAREYGAGRTTGDSRGGSATFTAWLVPSSRNAVYGPLADPALHLDERELFPGVLVVFLAVFALVERRASRRRTTTRHAETRRSTAALDIAIFAGLILTYLTAVQDRVTLGRFSFAGSDVPATLTLVLIIVRFLPQLRERIRDSRFTTEELAAAVWIVTGFIASLGWNAFLHPFLFRLFMPFRATRTPARWAVIVYTGLAVWAAMGFVAVLERTKRRRLVAALLLAFAIVEVVPNIRWQHVDPRVAPVVRWLAETKPGVLLELPIIAEGVPYEYILANSVHRVPMINGASGWETPLHEFLRKKEEKLEYDDAFLGAAIENDCTVVIVHEARLSNERKAALAPLVAKLVPLRRFGSDAVFRAPRAPAGTASAPRAAPRQ